MLVAYYTEEDIEATKLVKSSVASASYDSLLMCTAGPPKVHNDANRIGFMQAHMFLLGKIYASKALTALNTSYTLFEILSSLGNIIHN